MASFLILVSVVAALMPLVQGSATGTVQEDYATSDCSGAAKRVNEDRENACMEDDHDGSKIWSKSTCTATHAVRTWYSDDACSIVSTVLDFEQNPLACTASGGHYKKFTCGQAVNIGTMTQFDKVGCPASNKTGVHHIAYKSGCRGKSDDETDDNGTTWTDKSEIVTVEDGLLIIKSYSTLDCSGTADATPRNYSCTGACTEMPGTGGRMWYTITDCLDDTGEAPEGTAQTSADGTVSIATKKTADSSHRMSASGAGGLVALLAMLCLAQK